MQVMKYDMNIISTLYIILTFWLLWLNKNTVNDQRSHCITHKTETLPNILVDVRLSQLSPETRVFWHSLNFMRVSLSSYSYVVQAVITKLWLLFTILFKGG